MDTFYCVGCRVGYPVEKAARLTPAAHRDGEAVGFCFLCVREVQAEEEALALAGREERESVENVATA